jgi:tryptophan-rich sensory protein
MNYALVTAILLPVLLALVMNAVIYAKGWGNAPTRSRLLPPGWVIGMIWLIFGLLAFSLAYPVYTRGLEQSYVAKVANTLTLIFVFLVIWMIMWRGQKPTVWYMGVWMLWAIYVNIVDAIQCVPYKE